LKTKFGLLTLNAEEAIESIKPLIQKLNGLKRQFEESMQIQAAETTKRSRNEQLCEHEPARKISVSKAVSKALKPCKKPDFTFFEGMTSVQIESIMHQYARDCGVKDQNIDFEHMYGLIYEEISDDDGCRPDGKAWPEMGSDAQGDGSLASYVVQAIEDMLSFQSELNDECKLL
jgi:hypothetical protein